jgi:diguanylate cyclase (GGDEF)-like protein/PAS domain S-box-containing protein
MTIRYLKKIREHLAPILVMAFCSLLTIMGFVLEERLTRERVLLHALADAMQYQRTLQQGVNSHIHLSRDLAAYFTGSDRLGANRFDAYMRTAHVLQEHPGLSYVGYIPRIAHSDKSRLEAALGRKDLTYQAMGAGPDTAYVYPYEYAYPRDARSARLTGLDFSTIPERWSAMAQARDSGKSTATAKHFYINDANRTPIILVFTPVYDLNSPAATVVERRLALRGFVFSVYEIEEMIERIMGSGFRTLFDLEIYDGSVQQKHILYDGDQRAHVLLGDKNSSIVHQVEVAVASRTWQLFFFEKPLYVERYHNRHGVLILLCGFVICAALSYAVWIWMKRVRARSLLRAEDLRFDAVFENHPSAVYSLDLKRRFINANAEALKEFKTGKADLIGKSDENFVVPESRDRAIANFHEALGGNSVSYDSAIIDGEGARVEVNVIMIPIKADGRVISVLAIAQNVTERKMNEGRLMESRQMLRLVINHIPQRVFWKDTRLVYLGCNDAFCRDAGLSHPEEIIGKTDFDLGWQANAEAYRKDDLETINGNQAKINFEERQNRDDGSESWLRTSKIPLTDIEGRTVALLGVYEDITERKTMEHRLREMAHYDSLTGLANRAFFYHHLELAVAKAKRHNTLFALMYLDLDKFKSINDTLGHDVGDRLLAAFGPRLKLAVRGTDLAARLGGDEFAVLLENLPDRAAAENVARKLVAAMQTPFSIGGATLFVVASIGLAFSTPEAEADDVINRADQAMYEAKRGGRNRYVMDSA